MEREPGEENVEKVDKESKEWMQIKIVKNENKLRK